MTMVACYFACQPVAPKCYQYITCGPTYEALMEVLTEADRTKKDDTVYLAFARSRAAAEKVTPVLPKPESIFIVPMPNVTVSRFDDATFNCTFNRTFPFDNSWGDFMWRLNSRIIRAPKRHPFYGFERHRMQGGWHGKHFPLYNISTATYLRTDTWTHPDRMAAVYWTLFVVRNVDLYKSARVECWVRSDPRDEWWMVQGAYLHVNWQTSI
ncbi:uncharacterized protein LOC129595770 isoform X2 [Paramacrobiotus metropolitanus]|nr:uncharacterized protein LOC129595770 isoform X2 [Paramacrobiotus metropolitanus]